MVGLCRRHFFSSKSTTLISGSRVQYLSLLRYLRCTHHNAVICTDAIEELFLMRIIIHKVFQVSQINYFIHHSDFYKLRLTCGGVFI